MLFGWGGRGGGGGRTSASGEVTGVAAVGVVFRRLRVFGVVPFAAGSATRGFFAGGKGTGGGTGAPLPLLLMPLGVSSAKGFFARRLLGFVTFPASSWKVRIKGRASTSKPRMIVLACCGTCIRLHRLKPHTRKFPVDVAGVVNPARS